MVLEPDPAFRRALGEFAQRQVHLMDGFFIPDHRQMMGEAGGFEIVPLGLEIAVLRVAPKGDTPAYPASITLVRGARAGNLCKDPDARSRLMPWPCERACENGSQQGREIRTFDWGDPEKKRSPTTGAFHAGRKGWRYCAGISLRV
jgi:hypothetical protein